ncbi:polysaccharide ABC transporter ATP-binding protein [Nodosilinea sp. FACHB-13]|uniref:ABC transporter ATP-binding protein n=1 Tax=Cyanophyceae TaxID=3028117 RepID=UPI0016844153|nr:polysaccharide ABC transporter ATP-binding protein [Nodosilinea sp. FACHB-13]MBD2107734.1 ATP-binding cassette domain-containing protein [Nodosilinea sp. FACHB-13]
MSDTVIRVENLGKKYIIGQQQQERYTALRDVLANKAKNITQVFNPKAKHQKPNSEEFWALKDVSFEVKRGDRIGIIGRNGAGKSTLLKILSRITEPTEGRISIKGRVASLLEVGTGFHPELTGRENIYLNGAILGMSKVDIRRKFDEIVAFAEVERFLDTPVKRYSSGMYVRLAFAVAAHLEPEILVVDEVLAVGDLNFQKKCLGKMNAVASEGRTVIFVSHNIAAIRKLCERAVLLDRGSMMKLGDTDSVLKTYTETGMNAQYTYELPPPKDKNAPGYAHKLAVEDENGNPVCSVPVGKPWQVRINFTIVKNIDHFVIGLGMLTSEEVSLRTAWSKPYSLVIGEYQAVFREDKIILGTGRYPLVVGLSKDLQTIHYIENAGILDIADFSESIDLVKVSSVGSILNPMDVEILNSNIAVRL